MERYHFKLIIEMVIFYDKQIPDFRLQFAIAIGIAILFILYYMIFTQSL